MEIYHDAKNFHYERHERPRKTDVGLPKMVKQSTRPAGTHRPLWELHPDDAANASNAASVNLDQSARIR
jgi:hypothetical protein